MKQKVSCVNVALFIIFYFVLIVENIMLYKYDKHSLLYYKINWGNRILGVVIIISIIIGIVFASKGIKNTITEHKVMVIMAQHNQFSEKKLINAIKELNFQFPYIVYAQAILESNRFSSTLFKENNNLFGMKLPTQRINIASGSNNDYAYYNKWNDSVIDYAFYCATYLSSLKTEEDYFNYLSQSYAEDKEYINKLKLIIQKEDLISKFN